MSIVLVIAPHPDDETLGCGGTLLRHLAAGDEVHWLIVTGMHAEQGFSEAQRARRAREIEAVAQAYGFSSVTCLDLPTTRLDQVPAGELISALSAAVSRLQPQVIYAPFGGDVHSDHRHVFDAVAACSKWFRYPSVQRLLVYETLSETDFALVNGFIPNVFVDVSSHMAQKLTLLGHFESELGPFPFPRSLEAVEALARVRGAASGCLAAEAFMLLREIVK